MDNTLLGGLPWHQQLVVFVMAAWVIGMIAKILDYVRRAEQNTDALLRLAREEAEARRFRDLKDSL